jgi:Ca2+-binding RTX toxin-like protein
MKEMAMKWSGLVHKASGARKKSAKPHRTVAQVEALESRRLMAAGSVVQTGALVTVNPSSTGPNTAIVSYQSVGGVKMLDVNLNGTDHDFSLAQVGFVYYQGAAFSGAQTFENMTNLHTVAWAGSGENVFVSGGSGQDTFYGGSGSNTYYAGTGSDMLLGGSGPNVFYENATGSGVIFRLGQNNTINLPAGGLGNYRVY